MEYFSPTTAYSLVAAIGYIVVFAISYYTALKITRYSGIMLGVILSILPGFLGGILIVIMGGSLVEELFTINIFSSNRFIKLFFQLLITSIVGMIFGVHAGWKNKVSVNIDAATGGNANQCSSDKDRRFKNYISIANAILIIIVGYATISGNNNQLESAPQYGSRSNHSQENGLAPAAQAWIERNSWFKANGGNYFSRKAIEISIELEQSGYDRNDPALYNQLDRRLNSLKDAEGEILRRGGVPPSWYEMASEGKGR